MTPLEHALAALGRELELPAEPDLVRSVSARLEPHRSRRPFVLALAAAVLVALVAALAVPQARSTILRFFHLGGVTIERVETLPAAQERPLTDALGPSISVDEAATSANFRPLLPPGVDRVHVNEGAILVLLRESGKPVLLTEFGGSFYVKKVLGGATQVEQVRVGRDYGLWVAGARHVFRMPSRAPRMAGNVLLWTRGDLTLRLEGQLTKAEAVRLALRLTQ
ncbi:MAG: hypothetical protein ABI948_04350 [Thermoleophilia bacterium]